MGCRDWDLAEAERPPAPLVAVRRHGADEKKRPGATPMRRPLYFAHIMGEGDNQLDTKGKMGAKKAGER